MGTVGTGNRGAEGRISKEEYIKRHGQHLKDLLEGYAWETLARADMHITGRIYDLGKLLTRMEKRNKQG